MPVGSSFPSPHLNPQKCSHKMGFLVVPPQALMPPGATQNFRIQWVGEPQLCESQSYMLPVELPANVTQVQASLDFKPKR